MAEREIPWLRVLLEGAVIVTSILLALAADAWWAERQERAAEADALVRLEAEFAAVDSVMREWQANHEGVLAAGETLLRYTGPNEVAAIGADSIGRLLGQFEFTWTLDPPAGVLSSLIASGGLQLVENPELRAALASWQSLLDDLHGDELFAVQLVSNRLSPYLQERMSYRLLVALRGEYDRTPSHFDDGLGALLTDREFENLVEGRVNNTHWVLASYAEALEGLAAIRSLLEDERR